MIAQYGKDLFLDHRIFSRLSNDQPIPDHVTWQKIGGLTAYGTGPTRYTPLNIYNHTPSCHLYSPSIL
jgi:hypothetical protein